MKLAKKMVKGLIIKWHDKCPEMSSDGFMPGSVTHRNNTFSAGCGSFYARNKDWIIRKQSFNWSVKITLVFNYDNDVQQRSERELIAHIRLSELDDVAMSEFREAMREGNENCYSHTEFEVECLGYK